MTQVFIISEREDFARSVGRYLRFRGVVEVHSIFPPIPPKDSAANVQWVPQAFRKLSAWLEGRTGEASGDAALFNVVALIDVPSLGSLDEFDLIDRSKGWPAVVAMLLLSFPEVHWVIVSPYAPADPLIRKVHFPQTATFLEDLETILQLHDDGFSPLFDPTCLRNKIREHLKLRPDASYMPLRPQCAIAIDEEENYSYFNAYTAYRFGFRCHVITSYGMMETMLKGGHANSIKLTFEDIYLNFPDRKKSLSQIEQRDREFPVLPGVPYRVFVTSGHKLTDAERETWQKNNDYLKTRNSPDFYSTTMYKPESGVFDIWRRSGLQLKLKAHGGKAEGFDWPPTKASAATSGGGGTHSAPGRLLLIADLLIKRAGRILKNPASVPETVRGSLLALEAQEYLGHRTPTTSLEAVSLKHQLEVLAECMFYGVEYHLDTKSRFAEIAAEVDSIGVWFRSETRQVSELNAEIGILSELILSFRSFNQFNEEQSGLAKARHLHRRLWFRRHKAWAWIFYPARWYLDQLLSSMSVFIATLVGWLVLFGCMYGVMSHSDKDDEFHFMHGFEDAIAAFFGMQPPHDLNRLGTVGPFAGELVVWLTLLLIVMSFVHLGIFVSHLYSIVARR